MNARPLLRIVPALSGLASISIAVVSAASGPDQASFDACNRLAQQAVATPSASPRGPDTPLRPAAATATITRPAADRPAGVPPGAGAPAPDGNDLRGMAPAGEGDLAYQQVYGDCMRSKLWSGT